MILAIIYIVLFIFTIALFFEKKEWAIKYKKWLTYGHFVSLLILAVDIFLEIKFRSSFRTPWIDRLIAISFLITAAMTFAMYRKTFKWWTKVYFGIFFFYPAFAAFTFLLDRIFFVIVASPLIITLLIPDIYYSDKNYDIRAMGGIMAAPKLVLIEKGLLTETEIGMSDELIGEGNYKNFKVLINNQDSTTISLNINGNQKKLTFRK